LTLIRERIAEHCETQSPFKGEIEVDESYFGGKRIKGKRGRGAYKKTPVFGILKRGGKVYTEVVPDCAKATLQGIIRGRVDPDSVIHSNGWRGYDGLVDLGFKKHYRVYHIARTNLPEAAQPHKWYRIILGLCETSIDEISRHRRIDLLPASERMRIPIQLSK
jgi:transposase-like protein